MELKTRDKIIVVVLVIVALAVFFGGRYVQWKGVDAEGRKEEYLLAKSYMGGAKMEGHLCVECRKVILDIEQF